MSRSAGKSNAPGSARINPQTRSVSLHYAEASKSKADSTRLNRKSGAKSVLPEKSHMSSHSGEPRVVIENTLGCAKMPAILLLRGQSDYISQRDSPNLL
jgi:hypothetical protein